MAGLPKIPGVGILAEIGRDALASRYRLQGAGSPSLVLFHASGLTSAFRDAARRYSSIHVEGLLEIERVVRHEGRLGVILRGDLGNDLWRSPVLGELESLPLLHQLADVLAGLFRRGLAHGALMPGGVRQLADGAVVLLPPVILPGFLPDIASATGGSSYSPAGRDLSALGDLACHLVAGLKPSRSGGVGSLPEALRNVASPAAAHAVRIILEAAARDPSPEDALQILNRLGWTRTAQAKLLRKGPLPANPQELAPSAPRELDALDDSGSGEHRQSGRRIPALAGVLVLALLGAVLLLIGTGDALREFLSGKPRPKATLPIPRAPLDRRVSNRPIRPNQENQAAAPLPATQEAPIGENNDVVATALADEILAKLAKKLAETTPVRRKKRGNDQALVREGDRLMAQGLKVLADLRETRVPPSLKNAWLEQAITLLEQSREKYEAFAEQFPDQERLVEYSVTEVNGFISLAHKQKIRKSQTNKR